MIVGVVVDCLQHRQTNDFASKARRRVPSKTEMEHSFHYLVLLLLWRVVDFAQQTRSLAMLPQPVLLLARVQRRPLLLGQTSSTVVHQDDSPSSQTG